MSSSYSSPDWVLSHIDDIDAIEV